MALLLPGNPPTYQQPDQYIPESKKTDEWWLQQTRWISSFYNRPSPNYSGEENSSPVQRGVDYSLYYIGKQKNINYNYMTKDTDGNTLSATWIKSKKVKNLIDRLAGIFIQQLNGKEISAKSLSERAVTAKMDLWQEVMLEHDTRVIEIYNDLAAVGVHRVPPFGKKFDTKEQAEQWLTYSFKDDLEVAATAIGKHTEQSNDSNTIYLEAFKQDFAPSNWMGIYNYVENKRVKQKKIPFYNLIWDTTSDDPFVRDGRFVSFIERLTPAEIFKRWPKLEQDAETKEDIMEMAKCGDWAGQVASFYNTPAMSWYANRSGEMFVTAVTNFWIGPRDTTYVKKDNPKGGYNFLEKDAKNTKGDYMIQDLHRAVILGNKWIVEKGYDDNVVRSVNEKESPELPIKIMQGNTTMGDGVSIIGSVHQLIDDMDAFDYKIRDLMGRNVGKSYLINGNKLGMGVKPKELIQDLKTMNIHVGEGTTGEPGDATNNQPMVYPMDFSLDDAIIRYAELWRTLEARVEELLSLPKIAQGTQQETVGLGVQRNVIQQSLTGNANLFQNLFKFNQINLQYCVNLGKLLIAKDEADETARFVVGDRGVKALKLVKKYLMEDVLVHVSPRNIIDEQQKAQLLSIAQAAMQNDQITVLDFIAIQQCDSFSELENKLEYSLKKRQEEKQKEFAMQQEAAMQMEQMRQQGIQQTTAMIEKGAMEKKRVEAVTKVGIKEMDVDGKKEIEQMRKKASTNDNG